MEIINLSGVILTLIALLYAYMQRQKKTNLVYDIVTREIVSNDRIGDIQLSINGQLLSKLSHTRIIFRNEGEKSLYVNDLLDEYLAIIVNCDFSIIKTIIELKGNKQEYKSIDNNAIIVKFNSLHYNEEIIIDIYHTGSNNGDIGVKGEVRNQKQIIRREYVTMEMPGFFPQKNNVLVKSLYITIICAGILQFGMDEILIQFIQKHLAVHVPAVWLIICSSIICYFFTLSILNYRYWRGLKNIKDL